MNPTAASTHPATAYRPDIDGLRALAVLAVVLYHAWPNWFVGGFVGVDMFFVISGYLITTIIVTDLEAGRFSIGQFYVRRVRRIFPALALVLTATLAFGWAVLLHGEFLQLGKHALAGTGFVANLVLWHEFGYFDNEGITKPLLHLWSLGVEEQFYLLWPLALWLAFTRGHRFLTLAMSVFVLSMAANVLIVPVDPTAAFFSPLTRFWELMAGAIAAHLQRHHAQRFTAHRQWLSLGGAALLLASFSLIKPQALFPGWWALMPVAATFLLVMAGPEATLNRHLLARKSMVWIGLISYPLYLWHWPLISFAFIIYGHKPPAHAKAALLLGALLLAQLTYRLLELPIRKHQRQVRVAWSLAAGMSVVALASLGVVTSMLRERIETNGAAQLLAALNDSSFPGPHLTPLRFQGIVFQQIKSEAPGLTVFLGDSVVEQYASRIEHLISAEPRRFNSVVFATAGGCPPIEHIIRLPLFRFPLCSQTVRSAYALAGSAAADTVVIGAAWYGYFNPGQQELEFDNGLVQAAFPAPAAQELAWASLHAGLARLRKKGKRVFLIMQPAAGAPFNPQSMVTGSRFGELKPLAAIPEFDLAQFWRRHAQARSRLLSIAAETGTQVIEPADTLCRPSTCPVQDSNGEPLYTDDVHMRPGYSERAASFLDETIRRTDAAAQ